MIKIAGVVGARPQFVKAAIINKAVQKHNHGSPGNRIENIFIHTGQHYDHELSRGIIQELGMQDPDFYLGVGSGPHGAMTGRMLMKIEEVLVRVRPDWVLVYGDTNSTLAAAMAAVKLQIPVAHIEAGLRSYNRRMPEEINRILTDRISRRLFCPTRRAVINLEKEGITDGVCQTGDVMLDAFLEFGGRARGTPDVLERLGLAPRSYHLVTVHRQDNTDNPDNLKGIMRAVAIIAEKRGPVVFPIHPRTRSALRKIGGSDNRISGLHLIPPVGYMDMIRLESQARVILTDSGGMQKEAFFAQVPCITLREETEWLETVESGWNRLTGSRTEMIIEAMDLVEEGRPDAPPVFFGEGNAAEKIIMNMAASIPLESAARQEGL